MLRDLGVNTITVLPFYDYRDGKLQLTAMRVDSGSGRFLSLTGEKAERQFIDCAVQAKKAGFAVLMMPCFFHQKAKDITRLEAFDELALEIAKKWAQIAEAYKVEYFSPINEYDKLMEAGGFSTSETIERMNRWHRRALTEVRPLFKGKISLKATQVALGSYSAFSASGYDMLGITVTCGGPPQIYQKQVQEVFSQAQTVAERDNVDWWMNEFFLFIEGRSEEQLVQTYRLVFDEYRKTLKEEKKPVGFTFNGWEQPESKVKDTGVVPLLKQFFQEMDSAD